MTDNINEEEQLVLFESIYQIVSHIPFGKLTTYDAIADFLDIDAGSRIVKWALHHAHEVKIPKHRVTEKFGYIEGLHYAVRKDLYLVDLKNEGIEISNEQVLNFRKYFWDPNKYLVKK